MFPLRRWFFICADFHFFLTQKLFSPSPPKAVNSPFSYPSSSKFRRTSIRIFFIFRVFLLTNFIFLVFLSILRPTELVTRFCTDSFNVSLLCQKFYSSLNCFCGYIKYWSYFIYFYIVVNCNYFQNSNLNIS